MFMKKIAIFSKAKQLSGKGGIILQLCKSGFTEDNRILIPASVPASCDSACHVPAGKLHRSLSREKGKQHLSIITKIVFASQSPLRGSQRRPDVLKPHFGNCCSREDFMLLSQQMCTNMSTVVLFITKKTPAQMFINSRTDKLWYTHSYQYLLNYYIKIIKCDLIFIEFKNTLNILVRGRTMW